MQHLSHISYTQAIAGSAHNMLIKKSADIKAVLTNENFQKITLFTTILGLLLVAANLESIM